MQDESKVLVKKYETLQEAQSQAGAEVANTGGFSIPVVSFKQGQRLMLTGAIPIAWMKGRLEQKSAEKGRGSLQDTRTALNRPENAEHSRAIANYLKTNFNKKYIIPPLTLNVQQAVNLYTVNYVSEFLAGFLVIPATAKLAITDGQHRRSAIITALEGMEPDEATEFGRNAVAVMISCEADNSQIHQDFADASKTKPLPPSLLAVYDLRNPANRLVSDLEISCVLFKGRVDSTSKSLSKRSTYLFLANQVRQMIKELLAGSYAIADVQFEQRAIEQLSSDEQYRVALSKYSAFINYLTERIHVWAEIAKVKPGSLEASKIPGLREEGWVCLTATGLNLIGRVGHELFTHHAEDWKPYCDKLARLDWRRSADFWQGSIVQGKKIMTQQTPLHSAFKAICKAIDLNLKNSALLPLQEAEHESEEAGWKA
ncbi:MAG: DNA sulfur modification protein DndB [Terracidiphilus sp.]